MADLSAAHYGYNHQDVITAYALASLLLPRTTERTITIDRKALLRDCFDDLELAGNRRSRIQIKSHENDSRFLQLTDFTQNAISFRIDRAISSVINDQNRADEYRLLTTCAAVEDKLAHFLQPEVSIPSFLPNLPTERFRLNFPKIWPEGSDPLWPHVNDFGREAFETFCRQFVIELQCPRATGDLRSPGPLEKILYCLLHDYIGIGIWPNHNQDISDAAAHLLHAAKIARQNSSTLEAGDVTRILKLVTDYGRVNERFPIDDRRLVAKSADLDDIIATLPTDPRLVVTGPPGFGKSWLLNQLASRLTAEGWVVGVHYCFIDVLDEERSRRASVETTFGSIMAELYDADPLLATSSLPRYAAGPHELECLLAEAVRENPERQIAIIVDGLDHADRIPDRSKIQMAAEICEELNALDLPPGVALILGSQPGEHLGSFAAAAHYHLKRWPDADIRLLADRWDLHGSFRRSGLEKDSERVLEVIIEKAAGSPLYASYLSRTAISLANSESSAISVSDIPEFLSKIPIFDKDLDRYYKWLLSGFEGDHGALSIAELLSLIDFPISVKELGEIRPDFVRHIPAVIARLAPVLVEDVSRGGIRIHHESLQRYMRRSLEENSGASIAAVLNPVITWLVDRGFYSDLRAFRFLLGVLKRAGRGEEAIRRIDVNFVEESAAHCQPADATLANVALAGTIAVECQDWTSLAHLNEISRTAEYLYHWRLTGDHRLAEEFGQAYAARFGAYALSERLLHDGRCTFPPRAGLVLCKLCDEQGAIPPWREYRSAYERQVRTSDVSYDQEENAALTLARVQGRFRLDGREASIRKCREWLDSFDSLPGDSLDAVLILGQMYGTDALHALVASVKPGKGRAWARLALALSLPRGAESREHATEAIKDSLPEGSWRECLRAGADPQLFNNDSVRLFDLTTKVIASGIEHKPEQLDQWLTGLQQISALHDEAELTGIQACLPPDTWYRRWLRFCVTLARPSLTQGELINALSELSENIEVFVGKPRACDLYGLRRYLRESFEDAFNRVDDEHWPDALEYLLRISQGTTTWLSGSRSGPIPLNVFLDVCIKTASTSAKRLAVSAVCEKLFAPGKQTHELYDTHAEDQFLLTRIHSVAGQHELASRAWTNGCRYLSAYGYRKDVTVFELLNPLIALASIDSGRVRSCLREVQPIVERVLLHTDGRETRHAIHEWLDIAAKSHPPGALSHLAHETIFKSPSLGGLDHAIPHALSSLKDILPPVQLAAGWLAVGSQARSDCQSAISAAEKLISTDYQLAQSLWHNLAAILDGDGVGSAKGLAKVISESAARLGLVPPLIREEAKEKTQETETGVKYDNFSLEVMEFMPPAATNFQIVHYMRGWHMYDKTRPSEESLIDAIGWRLIERIQDGNQASAESLLQRIAYNLSPWYGEKILIGLAEGLALRGYDRLAALANTFAYTRGNDGWHTFAGRKGEYLFLNALKLEASIAWSTLSAEVGDRVVRGGAYGVTGHLIELLAVGGRSNDAFQAWDAACRVIVSRVPSTGPQDEIDWPYDPFASDPTETLGMAVVARINHCLLQQKRLAIAATALLASHYPLSLVAAVRLAVSPGAPPSTLIALLHILKNFEPPPYEITRTAFEQFRTLADSDLVSARTLARLLLERAELPVHPSPVTPLPPESSLSDETVRDIVRSIGTIKVGAIEQIWPGFGRIVAGRVDAAFQSPELRKRTQEVMHSVGNRRRNRRSQIWLPIDEEVQRTMQVTGAAVRIALAKKGIFKEEAEVEVGLNLLGDLDLSVRRTFSRTCRPSYFSTPMSMVPGLHESTVMTVPAGLFAGWVILGHHEDELVIAERYPCQITNIVSVYSGIEFGTMPKLNDLPMGVGEPEIWRTNVTELALSGPFRGPITGYGIIGDHYGHLEILSPNAALVKDRLTPAPFHSGLSLIDSSGELACVCRTWSQKHIGDRDLADEMPSLEGTQLLLRPDFFERIKTIALDPMNYVTVVTNKSMQEDDEE